MKSLLHFLFFFLAVAGLVFWAEIPINAQIRPDAPVSNFRLPMFDDDGARLWDLHGEEGRYISSEKVEVSGMHLKVFSGDENTRVENEIHSPEATILIAENRIHGPGEIRFTGETYEITGRRWIWDGNERSIRIEEQAKVVFQQELDTFLPFP